MGRDRETKISRGKEKRGHEKNNRKEEKVEMGQQREREEV
jgi:hypothetical protein